MPHPHQIRGLFLKLRRFKTQQFLLFLCLRNLQGLLSLSQHLSTYASADRFDLAMGNGLP